MSQPSDASCYVTRLTSERRGAVAVVSVEGSTAAELISQHFVPAAGKPLEQFEFGHIIFGKWRQPHGSYEEIVVCRRGQNQVEVNCHGGAAATRAIIEALVESGARERTAVEWATARSSDLLEAEAILALSDTRTERVTGILLDQYRGALRDSVDAAIGELTCDKTEAARVRLQRLREVGRVGRHLIDPWRIVFAGPPNVGKSSLINSILGYQRSIVFDQPGTTRDLLSATTSIDGWPVELVDSAGLRATDSAVEIEGVTRTEVMLTQADLTVLVFDATDDWTEDNQRLLQRLSNSVSVMNKCDLLPGPMTRNDFVDTSAITGVGIERLMRCIIDKVVPTQLARHEGVPFTTRQLVAIQSASDAISDGRLHDAIAILQAI